MKNISKKEFKPGTTEELLPGFTTEFPYIASRGEIDKHPDGTVPWHWHNTMELFYMESGYLEYNTPGGKFLFPEGSGGLVNANVLHMTKVCQKKKENIQLIHLFDPVFISGEKGSQIEKKYVMPLITAPHIEMIPLYPDNPKQAELLKYIRSSFELNENAVGYELKLCQMLSDIWLEFLDIEQERLKEKIIEKKSNQQIKQMMVYIHEHYPEDLSVAALAETAFLSERGCYRVFQECLHMTPTEYMRNYRLQMAARKLMEGKETITEIGHSCGLGSGSYFGKVFKEYMGCTPLEYRKKWQNSDK